MRATDAMPPLPLRSIAPPSRLAGPSYGFCVVRIGCGTDAMKTVTGESKECNALINGTLHRIGILLDLAVLRLLRCMSCLWIGLRLAVPTSCRLSRMKAAKAVNSVVCSIGQRCCLAGRPGKSPSHKQLNDLTSCSLYRRHGDSIGVKERHLQRSFAMYLFQLSYRLGRSSWHISIVSTT